MSPKRHKENKWPPRVTFKHGKFYFLKPIIRNGKAATKWEQLGKTEAEMYKRYAELKSESAGLMTAIIQRYKDEILIKKAKNTQKAQANQLERLTKAFGHMRPTDIRPHHIAKYHDLVGAEAPYQANRELALITHVLKYAVRWGFIDDNPAREIQRHPEHARTRYISDTEFLKVARVAPLWIRILMHLAYLTGQRRVDLLSLQRSQITDKGIYIHQSKTGTKLDIEWSMRLKKVVNYAFANLHVSSIRSMNLICDERGQARRDAAFTTAWTRLMDQCIKDMILETKFQFRDIRGKAGTDSDGEQLGHQDKKTLTRHYKRKPKLVKPTN